MVRTKLNPYLVLGVSPTATQAEITHAYRTRLRAHHPDTRNTAPSLCADEHLREVLAAYAMLRDPARRADYDHAAARANPPVGGVEIPITYRTTSTSATRGSTPPLRAGPVRRHRS
jgi:curved DNA-binding protein CbpA